MWGRLSTCQKVRRNQHPSVTAEEGGVAQPVKIQAVALAPSDSQSQASPKAPRVEQAFP